MRKKCTPARCKWAKMPLVKDYAFLPKILHWLLFKGVSRSIEILFRRKIFHVADINLELVVFRISKKNPRTESEAPLSVFGTAHIAIVRTCLSLRSD